MEGVTIVNDKSCIEQVQTDHGEHTRIRHCVRQRSLRIGRGRQWRSLCQR